MRKPVLSAVMLVYNGEKYLKEAIDSVLGQSFEDFEFIIINDGSTDSSLNIINSYTDERIRLINNVTNFGIPYSRNIGLHEAKGEYLAWCDCDDINLPNRFKEQVNLLNSNIEIGVCGTWQIYSKGKRTFVNRTKEQPELVKAILLFMPSIMNPTSMLRLSVINDNKLNYNENLAIAEDHDLFLRCSMCFPLTNVQKVLVRYRASETSIIKKYKSLENESESIHNVIYAQALRYLGIEPNKTELALHSLISSENGFANFNEFESCFNWLIKIKLINNETKMYDSKMLNMVLAERFYVISKKASIYGFATLKYFLGRSYKNFGYINFDQIWKLAIRCIFKYNKL